MIDLLRTLAPAVLAIVHRRHRDFAAAEDAVQEALVAASREWPSAMPDNPKAWLVRVAMRRMIDHQRAESARARRELEVIPDDIAPTEQEQDDTLQMLFMCCHPSLSPASAVALTLRAVGGLTTAEIAAAFMVPETTMAQRISRAKATIGTSPEFVQPQADQVGLVLRVLYLIFNEGYTSTRVDLAREGIRLARQVHAVLPDDAEVAGLLALMLLTDARRAARVTPDGELIPLDEQDRSRWDRAMIDEGVALISAVLPRGHIGPYQLQAAIAAVHDEAPTAGETDWQEILALYTVLLRLGDNPMVTLSHAIAAAMVHGPATGLRLIEPLDSDERIAHTHRLDAVRGHLYEMAGDRDAAMAHYRAASARTTNTLERNYLAMRAARLGVM